MTSPPIFPDTKSEWFVLPVKKSVRSAEGLDDGSSFAVHFTLVDPGSNPSGPVAPA